jgi:alpha-beta hydrolase superfamily lysophospholipase
MAQALAASKTEAKLERPGGVTIFTRSWRPAGPARAVLVICHGVNSHSGQYLWAGEQFAGSGLAVYALDLRGRGKSSGARFYVDDVAEYVGDLAALVKLAKSREPGLPVFLLGHSAGGVVSCVYALEHQAELAGLICESFAFKVPAPDVVLAVIKGLSYVAPRLPVLKLKNEDFSRDPKAVQALNSDPLIRLPVFILHGTVDKATVPSGSQFFYDTVGSKDKTLRLYEGHAHDLLNDLGKDLVMADMQSWISARLPKG